MSDPKKETKENKSESLPKEPASFIFNISGGEFKDCNIYTSSPSIESKNQNNFQDKQNRNNNNNFSKELKGNKLSQRLLYKFIIVWIIIVTFIWSWIYKTFVESSVHTQEQEKQLSKQPEQVINNTLFNFLFTLLFANFNDNYKKQLTSDECRIAEEGSNKGYAKAQYEKGRMYETGKSDENKSKKEELEIAKKYYKDASEQGYPKAQLALGKIYAGEEKQQEAILLYKKALYGFKKLAEQGDMESQIYLWYMYYNGLGMIKKDLSEANYWYDKVMKCVEEVYEKNCLYAQFYLDTIIKTIENNSGSKEIQTDPEFQCKKGDVYYYGIGIEQNFKKAGHHYQKSAKLGNIEAKFRLVYMDYNKLEKSQNLADITKYAENAYTEYKKLAEQGDVKAQIYLWYMYYNGLCVEKDETLAEFWQQEAMKKDTIKAKIIIKSLNPQKNEITNNIFKLNYYYLNLGKRELENLQKFEFYLAGKYANLGYTKAQCDLWYMYENGLGVKKDSTKAQEWLDKAKNQYNKEIQLYLGYINFNDKISNDNNLFKYFEILAKQGNVEANLYLAHIYANQFDETNNSFYKEALKWFEDVANQGYKNAQSKLQKQESISNWFKNIINQDNEEIKKDDKEKTIWNFDVFLMNLGNMYKNEKEVEQSEYWYKQVAECLTWNINNKQFIKESKFYLGIMYRDGLGVEKDSNKAYCFFKEAFDLYKKSAEQGDEEAQLKLGDMYYNGLGIEKNLKEAVQLYKELAEQGNAEAQLKLANIYYDDYKKDGVEKKLEEAFYLYKESAKQGNAEAQLKLANIYYEDYKKNGVEKKLKEAFYLYKESAEQGNAEAQLKLGDMYYNGLGIEKNLKEAFYLYKESAEQGNAEAQLKLGDMYYEDYKKDGVEKNLYEACYWYTKSAEQDNSTAKDRLGDMYMRDEILKDK